MGNILSQKSLKEIFKSCRDFYPQRICTLDSEIVDMQICTQHKKGFVALITIAGYFHILDWRLQCLKMIKISKEKLICGWIRF